MNVPVQITSRHIDMPNEMVPFIEERAQGFAKSRNDIIGCHVVVDQPHTSRRKGRRYRVRISVTVPEGTLVSDRRSTAGAATDNLGAAIAHAFRAMERQLTNGSCRSGCRARSQSRPWLAAGRRRRRSTSKQMRARRSA